MRTVTLHPDAKSKYGGIRSKRATLFEQTAQAIAADPNSREDPQICKEAARLDCRQCQEIYFAGSVANQALLGCTWARGVAGLGTPPWTREEIAVRTASRQFARSEHLRTLVPDARRGDG